MPGNRVKVIGVLSILNRIANNSNANKQVKTHVQQSYIRVVGIQSEVNRDGVVGDSVQDAKHTDHLHSVARSHFVYEVSVAYHHESPRHLSGRNKLRSLLYFKGLLVYVLALLCDGSVRVQSTLLFIRTWVLLVVADTRDGNVAEAPAGVDDLLMIAILAFHSNSSRFYLTPTRIGDDAWDDYELSYEMTLQVSEHARVLLSVDLHLELWELLARVRVVVVALVDRLHCIFKLILEI